MEEALGIAQCTSTNRVVRYADDFVVACTTREEAERALNQLTPWLAERGLELSEEKTRIVHIKDGFDFLGFNLRQYDAPGTKKRGAVLLIKPSRDSVTKIRKRLRGEWLAFKGNSAGAVIKRLNPIIRGWANYFRIGVSTRTFHALDAWMFQREVRYVKHMHPTKSWKWQQARYWGRMHEKRNDNWVFGDKSSGATLLKFSWFTIHRHTLVKGTASPDDPALTQYWADRQKRTALGLSPSKRNLAHRQGYTCEVCGDSLFNNEEIQVHHRRPRARGGKDTYENLTLRHLFCHQHTHANATRHEPRERT